MDQNDSKKVLLIRNETAMLLDDLIYEVRNAQAASELRQFERDVMELSPGFVMKLRQAIALKNSTADIYRQYTAHKTDDVGLMNYMADARQIIHGREESDQKGRRDMSIFKKIFGGSAEEKKNREKMEDQKNLADLTAKSREIAREIADCEEKMKNAIANCVNQSPESMVYRENQRAYVAAKDRKTLAEKRYDEVDKAIAGVSRKINLSEHTDAEADVMDKVNHAIGDLDAMQDKLAKSQIEGEMMGNMLDRVGEMGSDLLKPKAETVIEDTDFSAAVARAERQQALFQSTNAVEPTTEDEFAARIRELTKDTQNNND